MRFTFIGVVALNLRRIARGASDSSHIAGGHPPLRCGLESSVAQDNVNNTGKKPARQFVRARRDRRVRLRLFVLRPRDSATQRAALQPRGRSVAASGEHHRPGQRRVHVVRHRRRTQSLRRLRIPSAASRTWRRRNAAERMDLLADRQRRRFVDRHRWRRRGVPQRADRQTQCTGTIAWRGGPAARTNDGARPARPPVDRLARCRRRDLRCAHRRIASPALLADAGEFTFRQFRLQHRPPSQRRHAARHRARARSSHRSQPRRHTPAASAGTGAAWATAARARADRISRWHGVGGNRCRPRPLRLRAAIAGASIANRRARSRQHRRAARQSRAVTAHRQPGAPVGRPDRRTLLVRFGHRNFLELPPRRIRAAFAAG